MTLPLATYLGPGLPGRGPCAYIIPQPHQAPKVPHTLKQKKKGACSWSIDVWLLEPDSVMYTHCATLTLHTLV